MQGWNEMSNAGDSMLCGQHSWMLTKVKRVLVWKLYSLWDKLGRFVLNFFVVGDRVIHGDLREPGLRFDLFIGWDKVSHSGIETKIVVMWPPAPLSSWAKSLSTNDEIIRLTPTCFHCHRCLVSSFTTMASCSLPVSGARPPPAFVLISTNGSPEYLQHRVPEAWQQGSCTSLIWLSWCDTMPSNLPFWKVSLVTLMGSQIWNHWWYIMSILKTRSFTLTKLVL